MRQQECGPLSGEPPQAQQEGLQALTPLLTPALGPLLPLAQQLKKDNSDLLSQPVPCRGEVNQLLSTCRLSSMPQLHHIVLRCIALRGLAA